MFYSLNKMLSYMMSMNTTKDDIDKLEAIIRMFLISYDMVDKGMSDKPIPSFMSQYNFLCLLNNATIWQHEKYVGRRYCW